MMPYIAISYRDEGNGKGAFFDHLTVRHMTSWSTQLVTDESIPTTPFASYLNSREANSDYGLPGNSNLPDTSPNYAENAAFIFIPGYTRDSDTKQPPNHVKRLKYEKDLIRKAKYRGQPILAVCAGSWTLWESFGGTLKAVADHNYGGAMPRMSTSSAQVCNNKMIHDIETVRNSFVHNAMFSKKSIINSTSVNSVHWNAVDDLSLVHTNNLKISANSKRNDAIAPKSRQSELMKPESCVEAFETIHGTPMVGIQWHLEAFNPGEANAKMHQGIFEALKTAGETYNNRQELNKEF